MKTKERNKAFWYIAFPVIMMAALVLQPQAQAQMTSVGIDCSQVAELHLLQQENMRAGLALIECGIVQGGRPSTDSDIVEGDTPSPPNILVSTNPCTSASSCTHSESMVFASPKNGDHTVVVNYNHETGSGSNYSGLSYSTNGGVSFTQIIPSPLASGHAPNYGDPIVVFNQKLNKWFAGDLAGGCGGQGIGLWTSPDGITWTTGACAHTNSADDRESFFVDNNLFSVTYGRMYISFNNFNLNGGALSVTHSDDGTTWSAPVVLSNGFIRDVQVTGALQNGPPPQARYYTPIFVAAMDEGGGGLATRQNVMYRSLDGGVTWTSVTMGPRFAAVGDGVCSSNAYFAKVNPIIRHMGWGEPSVGPNGVVHYAYAGKGQNTGDNGDIYYVRSTDNGTTWSSPIKLNDDTTTREQWMPSVSSNYQPSSATPQKKVTISWYDRRNTTGACNVPSDPGCSYERYGIQSSDNGVTWGANFAISDQIINQPDQQDPFIQSCYAGDYDYDTALNQTAYVTWTDGRVSVGGVHVQNVEFAAVPEP